MAITDPTIYHNRGMFINHKINPRIPVINGQLIKNITINNTNIIEDRTGNNGLLFKQKATDLEINIIESHGDHSYGTEMVGGWNWNYLQLSLGKINVENNYHRTFIPYTIIVRCDPNNHNKGYNDITFFKGSSFEYSVRHLENNRYESMAGTEFTADYIRMRILWLAQEKKYQINYSYTFNQNTTVLQTWDLPLDKIIGIGGIYSRPFIKFNTLENDPVFKYYFRIDAIQVAEREG